MIRQDGWGHDDVDGTDMDDGTVIDRQYEYRRCLTCGQTFQEIDFNGAPHHLMCPNPVRGEREESEAQAHADFYGETRQDYLKDAEGRPEEES